MTYLAFGCKDKKQLTFSGSKIDLRVIKRISYCHILDANRNFYHTVKIFIHANFLVPYKILNHYFIIFQISTKVTNFAVTCMVNIGLQDLLSDSAI